MQQNFILQFACTDMLIHARLADRHNTHSSAKAVLFRKIPPVQSTLFHSARDQSQERAPRLKCSSSRRRVVIAIRDSRFRPMVVALARTSPPRGLVPVPTLLISQMAFFGITSLSL